MKIAKNKQFAALPYKITEEGLRVLFVTSRGTQQWILPKGKPGRIKGKAIKPYRIAAVEAEEEAGVTGQISTKSVGGFWYDKYMTPQRAIRCRMFVYLLRVTEELPEWKEKGQRKVEWVTVEDAIDRLSANTNVPDKKKKLVVLFAEAQRRITEQEQARRRRAEKKAAKSAAMGLG